MTVRTFYMLTEEELKPHLFALIEKLTGVCPEAISVSVKKDVKGVNRLSSLNFRCDKEGPSVDNLKSTKEATGERRIDLEL